MKTSRGRTRLIRSHWSPKFSIELSDISNYNMKLPLYPLMVDQMKSIADSKENFELSAKFELNCIRINRVRPVLPVQLKAAPSAVNPGGHSHLYESGSSTHV